MKKVMQRVCRVWQVLVSICAFGLSSVASAAPDFYAVLNGQLVRFNAAAPGTITRTYGTIDLLHTPVAIDVRMTTGELYVLYRISATSFQFHKMNLANARSAALDDRFALSGTSTERWALAFDPSPEYLRLISSSNSANARYDPDTGQAVGGSGALSFAPGDLHAGVPAIDHIAYTNAVAFADSRTLYGIDSQRNVLVRIGIVGNPDSTVVNTVGFTLGIDPAETGGGFVIDLSSGVAYAALNVGGAPRLYTINLSSGIATLVGQIGTDATAVVRGLAQPLSVDPCLDIDGDGEVNALTDGLMLTRILLGMTGNAVTQNAIATSPVPPRATWTNIRQHLVTNCKMTIAP